MTYGELGKCNLRRQVDSRIILFWAKTVNGKTTKLSTSIYNMLKKMYDNDVFKSKWITKVKEILDYNGFSYLWDQKEINMKWLKLTLNQRLKDVFCQKWHSEVSENRLCFNYRIFKNEINLEPYLVQLDFLDRLNLAKFRCGSHKLPNSVNRFITTNISTDCSLCNLGELGDEFHYTLVCPFFADDRKKYLEENLYTRPNTQKMESLFNSKNPIVLSNLAKFIKKILLKF
jgi:hypothetical protein